MGGAALPAAITGASVAAPILGGILGGQKAKPIYGQADALNQQAYQQLANVGLPDIEQQRVQYTPYEYLGGYDPLLQQAIEQQQSGMLDIQTDPRLAQAQMQALETLTQLGQTPFTSIERAQLNNLRREASGLEQARQEQILQSLASRGMLGSGSELAARLSSSQSATERQSAEADRLASMAQQRALQAIAGAGSLGGNIRSQQFGEEEAKAQAQDAINRFNIANRRDIEGANVDVRNKALQEATAARQRIAEQNVATRNLQEEKNKALYQQQFDNAIRRATGQATALGNQAQAKSDQAAATAAGYSQMGTGAGSGLASLVGQFGKGGAFYTPNTTKKV